MLEEHREKLKELQKDLVELKRSHLAYRNGEPYTNSLFSLVEGRISDLESMIAQDEYWEKKNV